MNSELATQYFIKAEDFYHYCPTEAYEALSYALSYDENHAGALCLMGKIYADNGINYKLAFDYFEKALLADKYYFKTYFFYSSALMMVNKTEEARVLLNKALRISGICYSCVYQSLALTFEREQRFSIANNYLNMAKMASNHDHDNEQIAIVSKRLKGKLDLIKSKKKSKKKKKSK